MDAIVDDDFWTRALARNNFVWDDRAVELLKRLWLVDQISARECGLKIGVSRCAIVGKVKRLGIQKRERWSHYLEAKAKGIKIERVKKPRKAAAKPKTWGARPARESLYDMFPVADLGLDLSIRTELSCDIVGLNQSNCHWPVGTPGEESFFFCGQEAIKGRPYCGAHCRIAYTRQTPGHPKFRSHSGNHSVGRV